MPQSFTHLFRTALQLSLALLMLLATGSLATAADDTLPPFATVEALVRRDIASIPGHERGDLICQGETVNLYDQIKHLGWWVPDARQIQKDILPDTNFLVQRLRTPEGRKLVRLIPNKGEAYNGLDRLSDLPTGKHTIVEMMRDPASDKWLAYLLSKHGGAELSKLMTKNEPVDFVKPTGKIYTVDQLVERLEKSYLATLEAMKKQ